MGAAASVVAWGIALCHEKGIRPFAGAARFVRGLPWGGRLALLPLFLALVVYGSTKYVGEGQGEGGGEGQGQGVVVGVGGESGFGRVERVDRVDVRRRRRAQRPLRQRQGLLSRRGHRQKVVAHETPKALAPPHDTVG